MADDKRVAMDFYLPASQRAMLDALAEEAGIAAEEIVEALVDFGLTELLRGNEELSRAVRTSRDGIQRAVKSSRDG